MSKFTLPNGVNLNGSLYNVIELDEIRGKHQNMLVNPSPKTPIDFIEPILSDLILDLHNLESESIFPQVSKKDLVLNKLPIQDIQFILIKIRELSYDKNYLMKLKCTHCEADNNAKLDLSALTISKRVDKITLEEMILPKDQISFRYGHLSLGHLMKLALQDDKTIMTKELLTSLTSFMLTSLGENTKVKPSDLDNLKGSDLDFIRDNAPDLSEPDMVIEHTCSSCSKDFKQELVVLVADFLLPTKI
jgi:hypothetical protein